MREPSTSTWRSRRVVRPNELFSRAYSSFPTRMLVVSSRCTTVATTLSRFSARRDMSFSTRRRIRGSAAAEREQAMVLGLIAHLPPARVVAVLLSTPRVPAGRLQVSVRRSADPHVGPRRRDRQRLDSLHLLARRGAAVCIDVLKPPAASAPGESRLATGHVPQTGRTRRRLRRVLDRLRNRPRHGPAIPAPAVLDTFPRRD